MASCCSSFNCTQCHKRSLWVAISRQCDTATVHDDVGKSKCTLHFAAAGTNAYVHIMSNLASLLLLVLLCSLCPMPQVQGHAAGGPQASTPRHIAIDGSAPAIGTQQRALDTNTCRRVPTVSEAVVLHQGCSSRFEFVLLVGAWTPQRPVRQHLTPIHVNVFQL